MADQVIFWLLQGDPAIRWQTLRDLLDSDDALVDRERALVARRGWGRRLLECRSPEGGWGGLYTPKWTSTTYTLLLLRAMGLPSKNQAASQGARVLLDRGLYGDDGINFWAPRRRCSETCVTGMVLAIAARFLPADGRIENLVEHLLAEQMPDGGWNCQRYRGASHSSLHTTISVLEALLEYEAGGGRQARSTREARERAHEFLYVHRMYCSHRTGSVIDPRMTRFWFPPQWHYDVLRGLDYLATAKAAPDRRAFPAIELLRHRRTADGTWPLQSVYKGHYHFAMEKSGEPSRWNTLRALRVLRWWDDADR